MNYQLTPDDVRLTETDEALQGVLDQQMSAWNAGDAKNYAATFARDAIATNIFGDTYFGRDAIAGRMAAILGGVFEGSRLDLRVRRARRIRPDVVVATIDSKVHGCRSGPPALKSVMLQVLLHDDGAWRVTAFHNAATPNPAPTLVGLNDLI